MRYLLISLVIVLAVVRVQAQVAVIDAANLERNTWTSLQSTITALQSVALVADSVTNLTGLEGDFDVGEYQGDVRQLEGVLGEAQGLAYDIHFLEQQISSLFAIDSAPDSTAGLRERLWELRRKRSEMYLYTIRVQTVIATAKRVVERIVRVLGKIGEVIGNLSAQEHTAQWLSTIAQIEVTHATNVEMFQRAQAADAATEPLIEESITRINVNVLADWPTR